MKKSAALVALIVLVIIGAGAFALTRGGNDTDMTTAPSPTPPATTTPEPPAPSPADETNTTAPAGVTIIYTDDGFSPASTTVKSGANVTVKNTSSQTLEFASDPHPTHTENRELNQQSISAGESATFMVTKVGTWGFHNHLRSGDTGTLVVEE